MTEAELIARAKAGDQGAFEQLVLDNQNRVYSLALRMLGNPEDAQDAAQEAFLNAWRALPTFKGGYHPCDIGLLTSRREPAVGQCQAGSLTGAVASERVSEAPKGSLRMDGNHSQSAKAEGSLTATPTGGAGTKVGLSDPVV